MKIFDRIDNVSNYRNFGFQFFIHIFGGKINFQIHRICNNRSLIILNNALIIIKDIIPFFIIIIRIT